MFPQYVKSDRGGLMMERFHKLDYKLYQLHYDVIGSYYAPGVSTDGYTVQLYGGIDNFRNTSAHYRLWGEAGAAGNRPTDRVNLYSTHIMEPSANPNVVHKASMAPHYDHLEFFNTSTYGVYLTIPFLVRWGKTAYVNPADDLMTKFGAYVGDIGEQVQVAHGVSPALAVMTWHGATMNMQELLASYGTKAFGFNKFQNSGIFNVRKKKWKCYLRPGEVFRIRVRVPGVRGTAWWLFNTTGNMRHGDYGLVVVCRGDYGFVKTAGAPANENIIQPRQQIAVKRTSTTTSVLASYKCGRIGYQTDTNRSVAAIPAGTVTKPEVVESKLVEKKEAF